MARQRFKQGVEGQAHPLVARRRFKMQPAIPHGETAARGNDKQVIRQQFRAFRGLRHGVTGAFGEQVDHQAIVVGIEVLHQDHRHAVAGGHRRDEPG